MYDSMKKTISSLTEIGMGLLALAIVASLLVCLLYTSPSPRDQRGSRMPSSA